MDTAVDLLDENICSTKQLTKDEAITFKNDVGLDKQSFARLLVFHLNISCQTSRKEELHHETRESGINFDDYISLRKHEQSNPDFLANNLRLIIKLLLVQLRPRILSQCMIMIISKYKNGQIWTDQKR